MTTIRAIYDRLSTGQHNLSDKHLQNLCKRIATFTTKPAFGGSIYNTGAMVNFLISNYDRYEIERAHQELVIEYAQNNSGRAFIKGRNPGSRNRYKSQRQPVVTSGQQVSATDDAFSNDDTEDMLNKGLDTLSAPAPQQSPSVSQSELRAMLDKLLGPYALKTELSSVATNIEKALRDYCEANFSKAFEAISNIKLQAPTVVHIQPTNKALPVVNMGIQHFQFPELLAHCSALMPDNSHLNIWLYGPAGTGKSTAAKNVSKALEIDFYTNGKISYAHELLGHMHGTHYHDTQFRQAYELGGVYCADEIDGWLPDALIALNGALANGHAAFPDKLVSRHPNFIFIGAGNTTGLGGDMEYVSRFQQDAAFNDRCVFLDFPIDLALEDHICPNKDWLQIVRHVRKNMADNKIKGHLITPRASAYGSALLANNVSLERVKLSVLKKGMTDAQWTIATRGLENINQATWAA